MDEAAAPIQHGRENTTLESSRHTQDQITAGEHPLRDRPLMPHVAELSGEHRGERTEIGDFYGDVTSAARNEADTDGC